MISLLYISDFTLVWIIDFKQYLFIFFDLPKTTNKIDIPSILNCIYVHTFYSKTILNINIVSKTQLTMNNEYMYMQHVSPSPSFSKVNIL